MNISDAIRAAQALILRLEASAPQSEKLRRLDDDAVAAMKEADSIFTYFKDKEDILFHIFKGRIEDIRPMLKRSISYRKREPDNWEEREE